VCNPRYRRCFHLTGKMVPIAQPEKEKHRKITSAIRLKLLSQGPRFYGFSFNGSAMTIESSFSFSARSVSHPKTFTQVSTHSSEMLLTARTASGASDGDASMFGKDEKSCMTRCGHQLTFLTSEFWHCWVNSLFIRLIRLLRPCMFPIQRS
jgi:hypothetical protein